jgi:histidinol-phosphate aminotransferase
VLVHFPEEKGKTAAEADAYLTQRGFVLRAVTGYGFPNALRMTIGSAEANEGTLEHLKAFIEAGNAQS